MTALKPPEGLILSLRPTVLSGPFWAGCARGELRFQRCADCAGATHTPAVVCACCTSGSLTWERSGGTGEVYSWTTVWRPVTPEFTAPYVVVIVALDEGWQMVSNLVGCEHDAVRVGLRVQVRFHELTGGAVLPYFEPALPVDNALNNT
jgi:uncharacterized OB-fold protein